MWDSTTPATGHVPAPPPLNIPADVQRMERLVSGKKNPFRIGDAVVHPNSGRRGIVKEISSKWVKFDVFGQTLTGGRRYTVRYSWRKVEMVMPREAVIERAQKIQQEMAEQNKPMAKVARWIRNLIPGAKRV